MSMLAASIAYHFMLGILLVLLVWVGGLGWYFLLRRKCSWSDDSSLIYGYPLGILGTTIALMLLLSSIWLKMLGIGLLAIMAISIVRNLETVRFRCRMLIQPLLISFPFIFGFAMFQGIFQHGPTAQLSARPLGDLVFYVSRLCSLQAFPFPAPYRDLLLEGHQIALGYASSGPALIGAALYHLPGFNAFLFYAVSGPTFYLVSLNIGFSLLSKRCSAPNEEVESISPIWAFVILPLLMVAALAYPTWIVESVPVLYAIPLSFTVYWLIRDQSCSAVQFVTLAVSILGCTYFTKVFAFIPFFTVLGLRFLQMSLLKLNRRDFGIVVGVVMVLALSYVLYVWDSTSWILAGQFRWQFLPLITLYNITTGNSSLSDSAIAMFLILGHVLLILSAWRSNQVMVCSALLVGVLIFWLWPGYGNITYAVSITIFVALLYHELVVLYKSRFPLILAAIMLMVATALREINLVALRNGGVFISFIVFSVLPPIIWGVREDTKIGRMCKKGLQLVSVGTAVGLIVFSLALANGFFGTSIPKTGALTPTDYDIWHKVKKLVPADTLIFSDFTGTKIDLRHGWNYYSGVSGRQMYIGGWYSSPLRFDADALADRLKQNDMVLNGMVSPWDLQLSRNYSSYFAVVERKRGMPEEYSLRYVNQDYAIYEIPK